MLDFLKRFGLGIVYILISPFLLAFLILWCLYLTIIFFIEIFKGFKSFFQGKKFFNELPEDIEAKKILSLQPYSAANENQNNNVNDSVATINNNEAQQ